MEDVAQDHGMTPANLAAWIREHYPNFRQWRDLAPDAQSRMLAELKAFLKVGKAPSEG